MGLITSIEILPLGGLDVYKRSSLGLHTRLMEKLALRLRRSKGTGTILNSMYSIQNLLRAQTKAKAKGFQALLSVLSDALYL